MNAVFSVIEESKKKKKKSLKNLKASEFAENKVHSI